MSYLHTVLSLLLALLLMIHCLQCDVIDDRDSDVMEMNRGIDLMSSGHEAPSLLAVLRDSVNDGHERSSSSQGKASRSSKLIREREEELLPAGMGGNDPGSFGSDEREKEMLMFLETIRRHLPKMKSDKSISSSDSRLPVTGQMRKRTCCSMDLYCFECYR